MRSPNLSSRSGSPRQGLRAQQRARRPGQRRYRLRSAWPMAVMVAKCGSCCLPSVHSAEVPFLRLCPYRCLPSPTDDFKCTPGLRLTTRRPPLGPERMRRREAPAHESLDDASVVAAGRQPSQARGNAPPLNLPRIQDLSSEQKAAGGQAWPAPPGRRH